VFAERNLIGNEVFQVVFAVAAIMHALGDIRPAQSGGRRGRRSGLASPRLLKDISEINIEAASVVANGFSQIKPTVVGPGVAFLQPFRRQFFGRFRSGILVSLEKWVALKLGVDEFGKFEIGKLKEADRLLQLGRHDQLLALSQL
jgi:hypothetical protein